MGSISPDTTSKLLPFDSVYKFLCVLGLILFLVCLLTPMYMLYKKKEFYYKFKLGSDVKPMGGGIIYPVEPATIGRDENWTLQNDSGARLKTSDDKVTAMESGGYMNPGNSGEHNPGNSVNIKPGDIPTESGTVTPSSNLNAIERLIFILCDIGGFVGLFMSILGFVFWYRNLQVYQDIIVQEHAGFVIEYKDKFVKSRRRNFFFVLIITLVIGLFLSKLMYNLFDRNVYVW